MTISIRRRRAGVLASVLFAALVGSAPAAAWTPRLGIEGGASLGRLSSNHAIGDETHWKPGGSAGVVALWDLGRRWSLEAAPGWEHLEGRGTGSFALTAGSLTTVTRIDQTIRFERVALPVRAAFHPASGWSLEAGMETAWLAHAGRRSDNTAQSVASSAPAARRVATPAAGVFEQVGTLDDTDWTRRFHRWDAAAVGGLGWDHRLARRVVRVRVRWQQGLVDIGKFDEPLRLSAASATVGLLW